VNGDRKREWKMWVVETSRTVERKAKISEKKDCARGKIVTGVSAGASRVEESEENKKKQKLRRGRTGRDKHTLDPLRRRSRGEKSSFKPGTNTEPGRGPPVYNPTVCTQGKPQGSYKTSCKKTKPDPETKHGRRLNKTTEGTREVVRREQIPIMTGGGD